MSYREVQRKKATAMRESLFRDPSAGLFSKKERGFVLSDATLNLWAEIRHYAIEYFKENSIPWWMGDKNTEATGHLLVAPWHLGLSASSRSRSVSLQLGLTSNSAPTSFLGGIRHY